MMGPAFFAEVQARVDQGVPYAQAWEACAAVLGPIEEAPLFDFRNYRNEKGRSASSGQWPESVDGLNGDSAGMFPARPAQPRACSARDEQAGSCCPSDRPADFLTGGRVEQLVARESHKLQVAGSSPAPAPIFEEVLA